MTIDKTNKDYYNQNNYKCVIIEQQKSLCVKMRREIKWRRNLNY